MIGKSHLAVGLAAILITDTFTGFTAAYPVPLPIALPAWLPNPALGLALAAAAIGALLPDIDNPESEISYDTGLARGRGPLTDWLGRGLRWLIGGHRGFTHSALALALVGLAALVTLPWLGAPGLGFALGYLSHVLADMLTREGVRLWWPLSRREVGFGPRRLRFRTGTWPEFVIVAALWAFTLWQLWARWGGVWPL